MNLVSSIDKEQNELAGGCETQIHPKFVSPLLLTLNDIQKKKLKKL